MDFAKLVFSICVVICVLITYPAAIIVGAAKPIITAAIITTDMSNTVLILRCYDIRFRLLHLSVLIIEKNRK